MSSYFTAPTTDRKRKRSDIHELSGKRKAHASAARGAQQTGRKPARDDSISGSEIDSDDEKPRKRREEEVESLTSGSSDSEGETAADRRLKLAESYLENVRTEVNDVGFDAEEIDRDLVAERLLEDAAESKGLIYRTLAAKLNLEEANLSWAKWNSDTVTSVATCKPWAYTVTHDLGLVKWKIQELPENQWPSKGKRQKQKKQKPPPKRKPEQVAFVKGNRSKAQDKSYQGHVDKILTVAASQDGKFVVTGGKDRKIIVWDATTLECLRVFTQHRDSVTGLAFRRGTNHLYSCSKDRTIKVWSLDELAYVETLFGHQDEVVDISSLAKERCVSVGARDRTARLWKVVEETQLVFRGGGGDRKSKSNTPKFAEGSIDRVAMIDEDMFVTGSDNGSISLWAIHKKKPICTIPLCHGIESPLSVEEASAEKNPKPTVIPEPQPRWVTALATIPYSDVILSGSWDGFVRVWKVSEDKKKLEAVGVVGPSAKDVAQLNDIDDSSKTVHQGNETREIKGVINDISIFERGDRGKDGVCIVAAVGKENRLGKWQKCKGKNGAVVFEVPYLPDKVFK